MAVVVGRTPQLPPPLVMVVVALLFIATLTSVQFRASNAMAVASLQPLPALPPEMANHTFLFILGAPNSAQLMFTKILCSHPLVSCLKAPAESSEGEQQGQHHQSVFKPFSNSVLFDDPTSSQVRYHLTADSNLITEENRLKLFREWSQYWDLSKPVLVESSNGNILKSLFLQRLFSPEQTRFLFLTAHPYHTAFPKLHKSSSAQCCSRGCLNVIHHWLSVHETAQKDFKHLEHLNYIRLEKFMTVSKVRAIKMVRELFASINLHAPLNLDFRKSGAQKTAKGVSGQGGPRLNIHEDDFIEEEAYFFDELADDDTVGWMSKEKARAKKMGEGASSPTGEDGNERPSAPSADGQPGSDVDGDGSFLDDGVPDLFSNVQGVHVNLNYAPKWKNMWKEVLKADRGTCQAVIDRYNEELGRYGYSIAEASYSDFTDVSPFRDYEIQPPSAEGDDDADDDAGDSSSRR